MGAETRVHKDSADDFVQSEKDIQIQIPTVTSSVQEFVQSDRGTSTDRSTTAPVLPVRLQTQGGEFTVSQLHELSTIHVQVKQAKYVKS